MSSPLGPLLQGVRRHWRRIASGLAVLLFVAGAFFLVYRSRMGCADGEARGPCGADVCAVEGCAQCSRCGLILPNNVDAALRFEKLNATAAGSQLLRVEGRTNAPAEVTLKLDGLAYAKMKTKEDGRFDFGEVVAGPGQVEVGFEAARLSGGRLALASGVRSVALTAGRISGTVKMAEGHAARDVKVRLAGPGGKVASVVGADGKGRFSAEVLEPGMYSVEVEVAGGKKAAGRVELKEENGYLFDGDFALGGNNSPSLAITERASRRVVEADIAYQSLTLRLEGTLPKEDKRLNLLLGCHTKQARAQCLPQFVRSVFGDFKLRDRSLHASFADTPEYSSAGDPKPAATPALAPTPNPSTTPDPADDSLIKFSLESAAKDGHFTEGLKQAWTIKTGRPARGGEEDSFRVKLSNYKLGEINPATPRGDHKHEVVWEPPPDTREISFEFDFDPSLLSLAQLLLTSPFDVAPAGGEQTVLYYLRGALLAVPLVWLLQFMKDGRRGFGLLDGAAAKALRRALPALVAVPFVVPVISTVRWAAEPSADSWARAALGRLLALETGAAAKLETDDVRVLLVSTLLVAAAASLLFAVVRPLARWGFGVWLTEYVSGALRAALAVAAMLTAAGVALTFLPHDIVNLPGLLTAALACAFMAWLVRDFYRAYLTMSRFALVAVPLLLLWLAAAAYPGGPFDLIDWLFRGTASVDGLSYEKFVAPLSRTLEGLRNFFERAQTLVPYVAVSGVALLLRERDLGAEGGGLSDEVFRGAVLRLGLIIFAAVLVGTRWTWALLPVPFALAFVFYKLLWLPPKKVEVIDDVVAGVWGQRRRGKEGNPVGWGDEVTSVLKTKKLRKDLAGVEKDKESTYAEREAEKKALSDLIEAQSAQRKLRDDMKEDKVVRVSEALLGIGPQRTNWGNAAHAVRYALALAGLPAALICVDFWMRAEPGPGGYWLLDVSQRFLVSSAHWLTAAFFFGYFFNYLCGENGVAKGLRFAAYAVIPAAACPLGLSVIWLYATCFLLFAVTLAMWAFDRYTFKGMFESGASKWKTFLEIENAPSAGSVFTPFKNGLSTLFNTLIVQAISLAVFFIAYSFLPDWLRRFH
jgi:hypothetical protein